MTELATTSQVSAEVLEGVLIGGDLSKLSPAQRVLYYQAVCKSTGLNPLTKPFDYIILNGKMVLYAKRDAADQLRKLNNVSIPRLERERMEDVYAVTAYAVLPDGRQDSSIGVVSIGNLKGDALANAMMKAETKAKRRVTLSICGLGWLDETEIDTIQDARPVTVAETGEIVQPPQFAPAQATDNLDYSTLPAEMLFVKNSAGALYIDLPTDKLSFMANSLRKSLKDNHLEENEKASQLTKLETAEAILKLRAAHHDA
jgi:hypothetical protein